MKEKYVKGDVLRANNISSTIFIEQRKHFDHLITLYVNHHHLS